MCPVSEQTLINKYYYLSRHFLVCLGMPVFPKVNVILIIQITKPLENKNNITRIKRVSKI